MPSGAVGSNPLLNLPNCIVTSHVAGVAHDTTMRIWEWAHNNVRAVVQRGELSRREHQGEDDGTRVHGV